MNPVLTPSLDAREADIEGCLSLPGIEVLVERPMQVRLDAFDINGEPVTCDDVDLARSSSTSLIISRECSSSTK